MMDVRQINNVPSLPRLTMCFDEQSRSGFRLGLTESVMFQRVVQRCLHDENVKRVKDFAAALYMMEEGVDYSIYRKQPYKLTGVSLCVDKLLCYMCLTNTYLRVALISTCGQSPVSMHELRQSAPTAHAETNSPLWIAFATKNCGHVSKNAM